MSELLSILRKEVKPALGCTGPTPISYAVSVARDLVGGKPKSVKVLVDRDSYKNSVSVGIPGTDKRGLEIAAGLGSLYGDSAAGLEVLKNVTVENEAEVEAFCRKAVTVEIKWDYEGVGLYIEAIVETDNGVGRAIIAKTHTNIILTEANRSTLFQAPVIRGEALFDHAGDPIRKFGVADFYHFSRSIPLKELAFIKDAIEMNGKLAQIGLEENIGVGYGRALGKIPGDLAIITAKKYAAAASDARMAGYKLAAMSCATSGNVGIAASLPLAAVAEVYAKEEAELLRAVALSYLITIFIKSHIGRLSAMCACAIAASVGVAAGTASLLGGSLEDIEGAIGNVAGSIGGVICDGAKSGCALKLASAAGLAIEAAYLALDKVAIPKNEGFVAKTADETIALLGIIASRGMVETDKIVCRAIIDRDRR